MHPILIPLEIAGQDFSLHTYGVMMALAFVAAIWVLTREAERTGQDPEEYLDLAFWILISAMVGSRVLFIIVNWDQYYYACTDWQYFNETFSPPNPLDSPHCFEIIKIWTGGLVFYGGFLGAVLASIIYCRKRGLAFLRVADTAVPSVALGQMFGRLGCLAAGCCWGKVCSLPWGINLPARSMAWKDQLDAGLIDRWAETSTAIHPTQLYESLGSLAIFIALILYRPHKRFHGQVLLGYLLLYPLTRSFIEIFRGDTERGALFHWSTEAINRSLGLPADAWVLLSTSQFISILVAGAAFTLLFRLRRRAAALPTALTPEGE